MHGKDMEKSGHKNTRTFLHRVHEIRVNNRITSGKGSNRVDKNTSPRKCGRINAKMMISMEKAPEKEGLTIE